MRGHNALAAVRGAEPSFVMLPGQPGVIVSGAEVWIHVNSHGRTPFKLVCLCLFSYDNRKMYRCVLRTVNSTDIFKCLRTLGL